MGNEKMVDKDKQIEIYTGKYKEGKYEPKILTDTYGRIFEIAELEEVSFTELLQIAVKSAYEANPYIYDEDKITAFLYWHDNYLFYHGGYDWGWTESGEKKVYVPCFFYTAMTKYEDVLQKEVFGRKLKLCVLNTSRPILVKIIDHIKETRENKNES